MSLKERITDDMKAAMRSGEKERLGVIRMITSAIKQREVDERITLDDAQVLSVLEKMIKQRKESLVQFQAGNRPDLVAKEAAEITLLQGYLPVAAGRGGTRCADRRCHRRHRRCQHQGHGQGHGHHQGQGSGPRRHGRGGREDQSQARRLTAPGPWPAASQIPFSTSSSLAPTSSRSSAPACRSRRPGANTRPAARSTARSPLRSG